MTDFSHLNKLNVTNESQAEYELSELEGAPVLTVRPANESNAGYMNGLLRLTGSKRAGRKVKTKVDTKAMAEMRDNDKALYPEHVIIGWTNMLDAKGKQVVFSEKEAKDLLAQLPNWIFDGLRGFANDPESFIEGIDSEEKSGN